MSAVRGKSVLITGASSGIGEATALALARAGARLALAARSADVLEKLAGRIKEMGCDAVAIPTDVTIPEQCLEAVERTVAAFGRLDVVVCSAGISMRSAFPETDLDAIERVMRVNFFGTLYTTYHAIPHVKETRGSLVALSSLTGKRGIPSFAVYGASKFAVQGLYESLRLELAPHGVHVGVFSSGFVETPLRERVLGPDGQPWTEPLPLPFRVWPLERAVSALVRLIVERRSETLFPPYVRPLLALDTLLRGKPGDRFLSRKFGLNRRPPPPPFSQPRDGAT